MKNLALLVLMLLAATPAGAHHTAGHGPAWTLDPAISLSLTAILFLYGVGLARLWRRSARGKTGLRRAAQLFVGGWTVLAGALVSPLHTAGERSFTFHMIEHELIMLVAALLLAASRPGPVLLWALPPAVRQSLASIGNTAFLRWAWRLCTDSIFATGLQAAALLLWHLPGPFDAALDHRGWHVAQHLSFLIASLLFWHAMLCTRGRGYALSTICLFVTSLVGGALGALMALSTSPWYARYAAMGMTPSGLTAAQDQQLAGLLMWVPGGFFHAMAALCFLYRWLQPERRHAAAAH